MILGTFSFGGFVMRWTIAILLVIGTINPSGVSYVHWVTDAKTVGENLEIKLLVGGLLVVGFIIYLRATLRSIGFLGLGLGVFIFATVLWWLQNKAWIDLADPDQASWIGLFVAGTLMGVGLSWSFIRRALSGQIDGTTGGGV